MLEAYPELKEHFREEAVGHAYIYNTLRDRLLFAKKGYETFSSPDYFHNEELRRRTIAIQLGAVNLLEQQCEEQLVAYAYLTETSPLCE